MTVAANVRDIAQRKTYRLSKEELIRAYVKLQIKKVLVYKLGRVVLPPQEILGFTMDYFELKDLLYLFDDIFVRQPYYFVTEKPDPLIVDCGSNIGTSILYFKKLYPEARIIAFEPFEEAFEKLRENVESNKLKNVRLHNVALSSKEGTVDFFYRPDKPGDLKRSTVKER